MGERIRLSGEKESRVISAFSYTSVPFLTEGLIGANSIVNSANRAAGRDRIGSSHRTRSRKKLIKYRFKLRKTVYSLRENSRQLLIDPPVTTAVFIFLLPATFVTSRCTAWLRVKVKR